MAGGGAERQLTLLAAAQVRRGHDVHTALVPTGPNYPRLVASGCTIHPLPDRGSHHPTLATRLWRVLRDIRPDIVHTWLPQMDILGGVLARALGIPWILMEGSSRDAYLDNLKLTQLRPRIGRGAQAIIANSEAGLRYWRPFSGRRTILTVIRNGLRLDRIRSALPVNLSDLGIAPECPVVLFVGRLVEEKNPLLLLEAWPLLQTTRPATLLISGDGPDRPALMRRAAELGIEARVRFLGYRDDIWGLMKRANALVSPSRFEGQPNAVLEAMAAGCPVVVSDIPPHREFLDDSRAILVPLDNPPALATAIAATLAGSAEVQQRRARALEAVSPLDITQVSAYYDDVYRRLRSRCATSPAAAPSR